MRKNLALIVAGIIFAVVALAHLLRLIFHTEILVSGHTLSFCTSIIAFIVALLFSIWMFLAAKSSR